MNMELSETSPSSGLLAVREAARTLLGQSDALPEGWELRGIRRLGERSVALKVGPVDGNGLELEWTELSDDPIQAFALGDFYAASYRTSPGSWDLSDLETPQDVRALAEQICTRLSQSPSVVSLSDGGGEASMKTRTVAFDAAGVEAWLSDSLPVGSELSEGWSLSEIYPAGGEGLAFSFTREGEDFMPRVKVRPRDDDRPAAYRTRRLDISYRLVFGETTDAERADAMSTLALELSLLLESVEGGVEFEFLNEGESRPARATEGPPPALNLAIPAPCGFSCNFCSIREEVYWVSDAESAFVKTLRSDIIRSGDAGTKTLRVNGIEPLNAPYLFSLLDQARESGFEEFHVFSTCRPLREPEFADRFLASMPERYRIHAPIYGSCPEVHEGVTGTPGSFNDLMKAVGVLREKMGEGGTLIFTTVLTRQNFHDMAALRDLVKPLGDWWEVHLAFPNTSSATDRYQSVSISMTDALEAIYPDGWWPLAELQWGEIVPCVAMRHAERTGHALMTPERYQERMLDPAGTFYASAGFEHSLGEARASAFVASTTPCPHVDTCAFAKACPGKVYTLYADQYGLDEFSPVDRESIAKLDGGAALLSEMDQG
jgi:hypothetical protein